MFSVIMTQVHVVFLLFLQNGQNARKQIRPKNKKKNKNKNEERIVFLESIISNLGNCGPRLGQRLFASCKTHGRATIRINLD